MKNKNNYYSPVLNREDELMVTPPSKKESNDFDEVLYTTSKIEKKSVKEGSFKRKKPLKLKPS